LQDGLDGYYNVPDDHCIDRSNTVKGKGILMELKYSETGIPYIELDSKNIISFSKSTANKQGFKWLVFSGMSTTSVAVSAGKGVKKVKKRVKQNEPLSTMIDMKFSGVSKSAKSTNVYLTKKYLNGLRRLFEPYLIDDIFPYSNIVKLEEYINNDTIENKEDLMEEDPNGYYEDDEDDE